MPSFLVFTDLRHLYMYLSNQDLHVLITKTIWVYSLVSKYNMRKNTSISSECDMEWFLWCTSLRPTNLTPISSVIPIRCRWPRSRTPCPLTSEWIESSEGTVASRRPGSESGHRPLSDTDVLRQPNHNFHSAPWYRDPRIYKGQSCPNCEDIRQLVLSKLFVAWNQKC